MAALDGERFSTMYSFAFASRPLSLDHIYKILDAKIYILVLYMPVYAAAGLDAIMCVIP